MSLSREISAITECSICTEPFVDPRVLPCIHTFCLKCLEAYGQTKKIEEGLACPLCRAKFDIPFSDLPINFFILKLIDVNKVARKPNENASCEACSGQNDEDDDDEEEEPNHSIEIATVYCFDCRQSLCKKCFRVHNRLRHNRCHLVVEFGKKQPDDLLKLSPTFCESHQDEIVKFFCSDCEKSICMSCYVESHSTHKCGNVAKVAEEFLEQLQEDVTKVSGHIEKCLSEEKRLATKKKQFLQLIKNKEIQANDMMKEMSELVETHGRQILEDLASVRSVKLKEFEIAGSEIQDLLVMMDSFKKYSQEVITKATPADVTRLASMLKKRAAELHTMRLDNFLMCDIDIHLLNGRQLLTSCDGNSISEVVLYNNRKDNTEAYLSSSAALPLQLNTEKGILGMTTIGNKFYLLRTERQAVESVQVERRLLATGLIRLQLQDILILKDASVYRTNYTQCNSVIFHVQLWYSKDTAGKKLQLEFSDLYLVEGDAQLTNSVTFSLDPTEIGQNGQPSNINQNLTLRSPHILYSLGGRGTNINIQANGSNNSLTVHASFSRFVRRNSNSNKTIVIPMTYNSTLAPAATTSPSSILEVYDIKFNAPNPGIDAIMKPSSIVFLPAINPTDMVSCCYYDCLYIGDESGTSIHRVDSRARTTKWLVQSIPDGLSVTWNHTVLVTSSQVDKLLEYTTLGVLLREICLTGALTRPSHSMEIMKDKFIVATESEFYLVSPKGATTNHAQTESTEKEAEKVDNATETTEPSKEEETCVSAGQEEGATQTSEIEVGDTIHDIPDVEPIVDTVSAAEKQEGDETLKVVAETLKDIGAAGVKPIRICTDQFGFIFVLTETKVHLLSPELKYVRELISLDNFGMQNPKHIHFQPESGRLYVASTGGTKQFLAFKVTEGKVDQCTWKK